MAGKGLPTAIEAARKRLNLSKAKYAKRIGISRQALYKILAGGGVDTATLVRLSKDGGVDGLDNFAKLMGGVG